MYFLQLTCPAHQVDLISAELWEAGTIGIREESGTTDDLFLSAVFESNQRREQLLHTFANFHPRWQHVEDTDWVHRTQEAWPGRMIGERLYLAAPWNQNVIPGNRHRLIHNPGLACGTGEHPCTQLALRALEKLVKPQCVVADIGTGSAILTIAAKLLGAVRAIGLDNDWQVLGAARENFRLNNLEPALVWGSADCVASGLVDIVVANINATVLLSLADDLLRFQHNGASLILTGFLSEEAQPVRETFVAASEERQEGWSCLICASGCFSSEPGL